MAPIPHFPAAVEIQDAFGRAPALVVGLALAFLIAYLVAWIDDCRRSAQLGPRCLTPAWDPPQAREPSARAICCDE